MNHVSEAPRGIGTNYIFKFYLPVATPSSALATAGGAPRGAITSANDGVALFSPKAFSPTTAPVKKKGFWGKIGGALKKFAKSKVGKIALIGGAVAGALLIPGVGGLLGKVFSLISRAGIAGAIGRGGAANFILGKLIEVVGQSVLARFDPSNLGKTFKNFLPQNLFSRETLTKAGSTLLGQFGLGDALAAAAEELKTWLTKFGARSGAVGEVLKTLLLSTHAARRPQA